MIKIEDVIAGKSYACKFRVPGPGAYEGIGVIVQRDLTNKMVRLVDKDTLMGFAVSFDDIWDVDDVVWTNTPQEP